MNTTATSPAKRPWTKGEKFLFAAILIAIVLLVSSAFWRSYINAIPAVTIPAPALPLPNAYDYFVRAGNAVVDGDKIGFAIQLPNAPHANKGPDHAYSLAEQTALVQENAGALKTLRQGFAYSYQSPPYRSFTASFPYYAKFRGMARLLRLQGETEEAQGDWAGAVGSQLDAVELGVKVPRGGPLIGMLVGIACQAIGRRPIWRELDHLDAAQSEAAARRLERLSAEKVPYGDVLQEEKWGTQAGLMEIFRQPDWAPALAKIAYPDGENGARAATEQFLMGMTPKRTVMDHYTGYMDQAITQAHQPYAARGPTPTIPSDPFSTILLPIFAPAGLKYANNQTQNAMLTATLALRAHLLDHGAYPATLQALVPRYLARVPDDPFALSGPLHYKPQGATYLLYSVGPDGKDDGGRPVFDATKPAPVPGASTDPRRFVQADSRGDIVAGVNLF